MKRRRPQPFPSTSSTARTQRTVGEVEALIDEMGREAFDACSHLSPKLRVEMFHDMMHNIMLRIADTGPGFDGRLKDRVTLQPVVQFEVKDLGPNHPMGAVIIWSDGTGAELKRQVLQAVGGGRVSN